MEYSLTEELSAMREWWREAGVEHVFHDAPQRLLPEVPAPDAAPAPAPAHAPAHAKVGTHQPAAEVPAEPPPQPLVAIDDLPPTLAGFRDWWLDPAMPLPAPGPRIAPEGKGGQPLLMLVPMPEAEDRDQLLHGPQGRLLRNLGRALGHAPEQIYLASALPAHMAMPDWEELSARGLGDVMRHHIGLAAPQRILLFGGPLAKALELQPKLPSTLMALDGTPVPVLATDAPELLLAHPSRCARLWDRLLEWTDTP